MSNPSEINQPRSYTYSLNDYNKSIVSGNHAYRQTYIQEILLNQGEIIPDIADIEPLVTVNISRLAYKCFQLANCPPSSTLGQLIQMNVIACHLITLQKKGQAVSISEQVTSARDKLADKIFGENEGEKFFYQHCLVTAIQDMQSGKEAKSSAEKIFKTCANSIKENFYNG